MKKKIFKQAGALAICFSLLLGIPTIAEAKNQISSQKAISIATRDAGVNTSSSKYRLDDVDLDTERGVTVWEIEFYYSNTKYEYDINASTGAIVFKEKEIGKKKAKELALKRAGVASRNVKFWDVDLVDNKNYYSVIFKTANYKYSLRIKASTGTVLKYSKTKLSNQSSTTYIGVSKAKSIALNHAKQRMTINRSVNYTKARLTRDDGRMEYEIEFYYNGVEFEYEIDAKTGRILDWDMDYDD